MPEQTRESLAKTQSFGTKEAKAALKSLLKDDPECQSIQTTFSKSLGLANVTYHPGTVFREEWTDGQGKTHWSWWVIGQKNNEELTLYRADYLLHKLGLTKEVGQVLKNQKDLILQPVKIPLKKQMYDFEKKEGTLLDFVKDAATKSGKTRQIDLMRRSPEPPPPGGGGFRYLEPSPVTAAVTSL